MTLAVDLGRKAAKQTKQFNVLLNSCKQNITSLSLLVGTTVDVIPLGIGTDLNHSIC